MTSLGIYVSVVCSVSSSFNPRHSCIWGVASRLVSCTDVSWSETAGRLHLFLFLTHRFHVSRWVQRSARRRDATLIIVSQERGRRQNLASSFAGYCVCWWRLLGYRRGDSESIFYMTALYLNPVVRKITLIDSPPQPPSRCHKAPRLCTTAEL